MDREWACVGSEVNEYREEDMESVLEFRFAIKWEAWKKNQHQTNQMIGTDPV